MDFRQDDALAEYRQRAAQWVQDNVDPTWAVEQSATGTYHTWELHRRMARDGLLASNWPAEYGGSDVDPNFAYAVSQALADAGLHLDGWVTTEMVLLTVLAVGTEEQKQQWVRAGLAGEMLIVLGYSEPGSGSDAAAAATRAVRDGDEWTINGSKMFTSTAHEATHVFMLTRSNTEVAKHKGLSMFMVPLDAPGVEIQPIYTLGGQRTNATFYTDVRVPDSDRVGEVDGGWNVMRVALIHERATPSAPVTTLWAEKAAQWAKWAKRADGSAVYDDPIVKEKLGWIAVENEVARLLGMRTQVALNTPQGPTFEGPESKLFYAEANIRHLATVLDLAGEQAVVQSPASKIADKSNANFIGATEGAYRRSLVGTIYGGSTEVMREIVAERVLMLPRTRAK